MPPPGQAAERNGPRRDVLTTEVLDKAAGLLATRGFAATSLQDIANEVGLSRTSMYYYVSSKEALLDALIRGVACVTDASGRSGSTERAGQPERRRSEWRMCCAQGSGALWRRR